MSRLKEQMKLDYDSTDLLDTTALRNYLRTLEMLKEQHKAAVESVEKLDAEIKEIERELIPDLFDSCGVSRLTFEGRQIEIRSEVYPHVLKEREPEFFNWLHDHNFGSLIKNEVKVTFGAGDDEKAMQLVNVLAEDKYDVTQKMTVHPSTLKAFIKEQFSRQDKGEGIPFPDCLNINPVRVAVVK